MVVVGAIHVYPDLRFLRELGPQYAGIHFIAAVDETTYLSRISRVLAGSYRLGNAMIWEHRDDPFTYAPLPEYVEGTIGRALGLSIAGVDIVATALLPPVIFGLFFLLVRDLTGRFGLGLVGGLVLTFGQYLVAKQTPLFQGRLHDPSFPHSLQFVRPVSPQFHYVVFLLALWLLYRVYAARAGPKGRIAAGLTWGLAFYLNFFFWTFLAAGLVLWTLEAVARGERWRWQAALSVLVIGVLVGSYYFVNAAWATALEGFAEASLRGGVIYTRQPILPALHIAWLVLFGAWFVSHRGHVPARFVLVFLVAGLLCLNQQLLTGRTVQPFHWETQTNKVLMLLALFMMTGAGLSRLEAGSVAWRRLRPVVGLGGAAVAVIAIAHAGLVQENYYRVNRGTYAGLQELGPALAWLRQATPADAVVLANPAVPLRSELITVYAQRYAYVSEPFFNVSLVPQREVDDRYLVAMLAFGVDEAGLQRVLHHGSGSLFFGMHALPGYHRGDDRMIREHLVQIGERYRQFAAGGEPSPIPRRYRLDYLLVSAGERPRIREDVAGATREVYADGRFQILALQRWRTS